MLIPVITENIGDVVNKMPSLLQIKQDIIRYTNKYKPNVYEYLYLQTDLDSILDFNELKTETPKYFNKSGILKVPASAKKPKLQIICTLDFSKQIESTDLEITLAVNLGNLPTSYDTSIQLIEFMEDWSEHNWSYMYKLAIREFKKFYSSDSKKSDKQTLQDILKFAGISDEDEFFQQLMNIKALKLFKLSESELKKFVNDIILDNNYGLNAFKKCGLAKNQELDYSALAELIIKYITK